MMRLFTNFDLFFFKIITVIFSLTLVRTITRIYSKGSILRSYKNFSSNIQEILYSFIQIRVRQGVLLILIRVFTTFVFLNLFSVNPFVFPLRSQTSTVLFIGAAIWISFTIFSCMKNYLGNLAHLIPEGAPIYIAVFLIVIEFVRIIIRPLTLRVRIIANILAGHLLMILLSKMVLAIGVSMVLYVALNIVEIFVACIQAYIFTVIIVLYYRDSN